MLCHLQHTTLGLKSACITQLANAYMANGTVSSPLPFFTRTLRGTSEQKLTSVVQLPDGDDTVCQADADFEIFPGVNTEEIMKRVPTVGF